MIEVVAEKGYDAVGVRDIVHLAKVSSRSFYQHFGSKDECFVRTYEMIVSRARIGLIGCQTEGKDWRERARQIFAAFAHAIAEHPAVARFALIDVYADGPVALERAYQAEANFVSMLAKSLGRPPNGVEMPMLVAEGMMSGIFRIARAHLLAGTEERVVEMEDEIMEWVLSFPCKESTDLVMLDTGIVKGNAAMLETRALEAVSQAPGDTRTAILAAVSKLAVADDYAYRNLTVPLIRASAGISRKNFDTQFDSIEECFLVALELRAAAVIADAATEQTAGATWEGGVYRAISSLSIGVAADPLLARVCLRNDFVVASKGAQARARLAAGVVDQICSGIGPRNLVSDLIVEASGGAIWGLYHHHVLRNWVLHKPEISATLGYMALAPLVGGVDAIAAMRDEQVA